MLDENGPSRTTIILQERAVVNHVFNLDNETWFYLT